MQEREKPFVIGIAGSSGSGKTLFLNCFLHHFKDHEVTLISQDDYYLPANTKTQEENKRYNFDLPTAINRDGFHRDILDLFEGKTVYKEEYTFNNPLLKAKMLEIKPAPILIIEGLFIFYYSEVNALLDQRIFLHADDGIALERRIKRDLTERGYDEDDVRYKWFNHVLPAFRAYLLPYKSGCDLIIENNEDDMQYMIDVTNAYSEELRKKVL